MRTSIRTVPPPPDTFSRRAPQQAPSPSPIVSGLSLAQPRPGPRTTNEYVDSLRARPQLPLKTHVQSPTLIAGQSDSGGGSHSNHLLWSPPRLRSNNNHNGGGLHHSQHGNNQQLSLHQLAAARSPHHHHHRHQHRGTTNLSGTPGSQNNTTTSPSSLSSSPIVVITNQPVTKLATIKKDIIPLDGFNNSREESPGRTAELLRQTPWGSTPRPGSGVPSPSNRELSTLATIPSGNSPTPGGVDGGLHAGIICDECGKCRCRACTEQRELPCQAWCCGGKCELTPTKALDVCTCFCAVKCVFYHCLSGQQDDDNDCYENPCGCCATPHCCPRWTILGFMSACLPCLCAYWPARGCLATCTGAYNACCRHKGCRCDENIKSGTSSTCHTSGTHSTSSGSSGGNTGHSAKTCGLSSVRGGVVGNEGGGGGSTGLKSSSKHSQARRLLIESDSSSA